MTPRRVALWRLEQIEELLDEDLSATKRRALLRRRARLHVLWPSGDERPVSEATLYRWIRAYRKGGLHALEPPRRDPPKRRKRPPAIGKRDLLYAVGLLREEPGRSLTLIQKFVQVERQVEVARSTLHRHEIFYHVRNRRRAATPTRRERGCVASP